MTCGLCSKDALLRVGYLCLHCNDPLIACGACVDAMDKRVRDHAPKVALEVAHRAICRGRS